MPLGTVEPLGRGLRESLGLQNADCVLPACKRTVSPGKLTGTRSQWHGGDEWSYQGARVLPGVAGADPGHCATGQEHQLGPLLSLMSVLVFNHPLRIQKTLILGREEGGGFRMGNTCIPVADSFCYLAKLIQLCKV